MRGLAGFRREVLHDAEVPAGLRVRVQGRERSLPLLVIDNVIQHVGANHGSERLLEGERVERRLDVRDLVPAVCVLDRIARDVAADAVEPYLRQEHGQVSPSAARIEYAVPALDAEAAEEMGKQERLLADLPLVRAAGERNVSNAAKISAILLVARLPIAMRIEGISIGAITISLAHV